VKRNGEQGHEQKERGEVAKRKAKRPVERHPPECRRSRSTTARLVLCAIDHVIGGQRAKEEAIP
jgi:hypothetical protein